MQTYTAPALTDLGTFGELTLGGGIVPIYDGFIIGFVY
ncbi:lasso RiPP family leader peptide-containing protein [Nocardiopsis sp. RSe5-2]|uniref:Lasso RiPP family leader peptide-containing protein n=1 Tax=Nocardiopsis endophytica TaxID=3018445 RepID=A0ABT4TXS7_9ACTN|nr:lasso RiPP family leader peptide-containing protein [Nocardiopsis endophytica]MDA2809074.1 lasso RiPP family leader peptide-containing protein [Nocardiopsis endophytica]